MAIDAETIANLSPVRKLLLVFVIVLVVIGLFWQWYYKPKSNRIKSLQSDLSEKQARLNENEAIARNLPRFQEEDKKLKAELGMALQKLPNSREIPNLLETISDLGSMNGLDVIYIKPQNDVDKGFYAEVPISIRVKGGYNEMGLFLDAVSKLPRIINVSDITMGNAQEDEKSGVIVLDISALATTYRYIETGG
ncbi:MAG: type 4a pilus biogenesis protein PilO [Pseudomonadota bacterium]|jgi:type IV pilus assembly protein PilO